MRPSAQSKSGLGCFDPDLIDIYWFAFTKWSWPLGPQPNHTKVVWTPKVQTTRRYSFDIEKWGGPQSPTPNFVHFMGWAFDAHPTFRYFIGWALGAHPTFMQIIGWAFGAHPIIVMLL